MIGYLNIERKQKVSSSIKDTRKVWLQHNNILVLIKDKIRVIVTKILYILLCFK